MAYSLAGFLGIILVFSLSGRLPVIADIYNRIQAGLVRAGTSLGNVAARVMQNEESISRKFQVCETQLRQASAQAVTLTELQTQVQELQALLNYERRDHVQGVTAQVIARAVDDDVSHVIVDRGARDGLIKGSAAVIDSGTLFGFVEEVRDHTAILRLVSNPNSHIDAAVLGQRRTIGLVDGREGALLEMAFIPQDVELKQGDLVVTSGLDGLVQENLVIGQVTEIISSSSAPFKTAYLELLYEPREWTTVLILPPPGL